MARDRLAAMRAQQASAAGGYTSPGAGAGATNYEQEYGLGSGNNGYGDHLFPTQQATGQPYVPPSSEPAAAYAAQPQGVTAAAQQPATYVPPTSNPSTAYAPATHAAQQPDSYEMTSMQGVTGRSYVADQAATVGLPDGGAAPAAASTRAGAGAQSDSYAVNMSSDPTMAASTATTTGSSSSFFGRISEIQDMIRQIDLNVNRISDLHSRSLNNVGEAAQLAAESELSSVAQQTSMYTNFVKTSIKSLEAEAVKIPASGPAPEGVGRNVRLTQIGAAKNRFKETIMRYQEVEKAYRTKYRQRTERQLRIVKPDATQAELQSALEGEASGQQIFSQALMNSNRQGEARGALREVQERHTDIQRIERTITELAALFQEMSILAEQQDEQLNVIKDHAQHTEHEVQAGRQQTDKAVVAARRARKRRWICFWLVVIIIAIIIAAVVGGVCGHGDTCSSNKN